MLEGVLQGVLQRAADSLCSMRCVPSLPSHAVVPLSLPPPSLTLTTLPCPFLAADPRQLMPSLSVSRSSALSRSAASSICAHVCVCVRVRVCVFGCIKQTHEYILYVYIHTYLHVCRERPRAAERGRERERERECMCVWSHIDLFVCFSKCCSVAVCCRLCWGLLQYVLQCVDV